jgi:fumarate reductase subunit C
MLEKWWNLMWRYVHHMLTEQQLVPLHILYIESIYVLLAFAEAVKDFACNHGKQV